ncbi:Outer envelope pore protein 16-2, chloroplastic [Ananas comosus]|uniref:Outer envelope pore protein 16-2, chloroplastic n=1 Tax=Ananas comosus TaxID=4615 RepID=A0A199UY97_ANACO|nr:Outer envelope pore protein 16-2, chloroplastic [Ananas comosus]
MSSNGGKLETRTFLDEIRSMEKGWLFDLGHPLLNRIAESFVKAAGIGAIQAISREAYFTAVEGENGKKSLEVVVKNTSKESLQWDKCYLSLYAGMAAGVYSGLTYGLREVRGTHDWKNSAVAGAITGAAVALTSDNASHEQIVQCAITGAALSTAANLLSGIF